MEVSVDCFCMKTFKNCQSIVHSYNLQRVNKFSIANWQTFQCTNSTLSHFQMTKEANNHIWFMCLIIIDTKHFEPVLKKKWAENRSVLLKYYKILHIYALKYVHIIIWNVYIWSDNCINQPRYCKLQQCWQKMLIAHSAHTFRLLHFTLRI